MPYIRPLEIILAKKTTEIVLLFHKKTTKIVSLAQYGPKELQSVKQDWPQAYEQSLWVMNLRNLNF